MDDVADRLPISLSAVRIGLVVFVLAWILGPDELRSAVPIWIVFLIALGLEVNFLVGAFRTPRARSLERGPQAADRDRYGYEDDGGDLLLVHDGDEELWIPYSGETDDELESLIAEAREHPRTAEPDMAVEDRRSRWYAVRRFLTGLGVIALLALVLWFVESRTGWDAVAGDTRAVAVTRFSAEASRIAGKPVAIRCDESRDYVGFVQHADGVAIVGGDRAYLTPERCYDLYRLGFEDEVTVESDCPCARRPRARGVASSRRARRGDDRVLRVPVGRRARRAPRALGGDGAADDATTAHRKQTSKWSEQRVPRSERVSRRRQPRPEPDYSRVPVAEPDQRSSTTSSE